MIQWICHTRRYHIWKDDIHERLRVAAVEEKLVQHRSGVISWTDNGKRGRGRPNLTCNESVKRNLKNWIITKELALDRRVEASNLYVTTLIFGSSSFFYSTFFTFVVFQFFYCLFSLFLF
jgi:hypothetical protein